MLRTGTLEEQFYRGLLDGLREEEAREERIARNPFSTYSGNLRGFCEQELGKRYTEDQLRIIASVDGGQNPVTLAKAANSVGKTNVAADLCVAFLLVYSDSQVVTFCAPPEENLKLILWGEIGNIVEEHPRLFDDMERVSLPGMLIKRNSRSYLTGLAIPQAADPDAIKARFSGKHAPKQLFVGDEGDGVPKPILGAIEGSMSGSGSAMLLLYNPRNPSGALFQMENAGEAVVIQISAFNHPNVRTGRDIIPGAIDREKTVWRINKWTHPLAPEEKIDAECYEVPDFLVGYVARERNEGKTPMVPLAPGWRRILQPEFAHMVLGQYPSASTFQLISRAWVENAFARYQQWTTVHGDRPPTGVSPVLGLDVADIVGADKSVATPRYGSWVGKQHEWEGLDPVQVGEHTGDLYAQIGAHVSKNDGTGVGAGSIRPMRRRGCVAWRIMASAKTGASADDIGVFSNVRTEMLWYFREWLKNDPAAAIYPSKQLLEECIAPKYWVNARGEVQITDTETLKDILNRSPDHLMSLGFTFAPEPENEDNEPAQMIVENYLTDMPKPNGFSQRVRIGV